MNKLIIIISLLFSLSPSAHSEPMDSQNDNLKINLDYEIIHTQKDESLLLEIIEILEKQHFLEISYQSIRLDSLENFIKSLDPARNIFLAEEVNKVTQPALGLSEDIKKDLKIVYQLFDVYKKRYLSRYELQTGFLSDIKLSDLERKIKILKDRTETARAVNVKELNKLWERIIINDVIQLMLSGNELEEAKIKLLKRMNNQLNFFKQTRDEDIFNIYANSVTSSYGPHTNYMSPKRSEDFDINMSLSLEGIGALLSSDGMYTSISSLVAGGPAEKSETLKPNDKIVGIAQEDENELTDVIGWRIDDVVKLIRGPKGTKVKLEVIPSTSLDDSNTKKIEIVRGLVELEDQAAEKDIIIISRPSGEYKIGIIELPAFYFDFEAYQKRDYNYRSSSKDVKKLIKELKDENVDGLILDLRNNGGGSLYEANALAHLLLGRGTTVQIKNSEGVIQSLGEKWGYQFYNQPLAILVNKFSASASEILAGAVQDYDRGVIVGTQTFGKGTVQRVDQLSSGQIKFTESKFYRVTGSSTQNMGVLPDINLPTAMNLDKFGESELPKALKHDKIPTSKYRNFSRIEKIKAELKSLNSNRIDASIFYNYLEEIKTWRKSQESEWINLSLTERKEQKERIETELLALENSLRSKLNLPTFTDYQSFLERDEDPDELNIKKKEIKETANILIDIMEISKAPLIALNKTG